MIFNFKFIVGNNAFVQLHNLTLNSEVYIDDGSSVRFETVTINGHIEANNNSTALLKNSTLNGTTDNPPGGPKSAARTGGFVQGPNSPLPAKTAAAQSAAASRQTGSKGRPADTAG